MQKSDAINDLAAALAKAQGDLMGAKKDTANPFFKSKYADLASIVDALKACFPKHGLSYVQTIVTNDHGVGVETMLLHSSGQWIAGEPFYLPVNKADAQGFGSCATYARRYSLAAIAGVAPEDDDGNAAAAAKPTPVQKVAALDNKVLPKAIPANIDGQERLANMPDDAQRIMREWAAEAAGLVEAGAFADAWDFMHEKCPEHDDYVALWSLLASIHRNKIKKWRDSTQLASQA